MASSQRLSAITAHEFKDAHGCRNAGMPLGGLGAGSLELRPDGYFYRWMIANNRPWGAGPETEALDKFGLRFGLAFELGNSRRVLALGLHPGLDPKLDGWFWAADPYHLPWVEHAQEIEYKARIPFARLTYHFPGAPLRVQLTAWSPFIPHHAADSNTPGVVLTFRVSNLAGTPASVALFGLLKNAAGYDHPELPSVIQLRHQGLPGLLMTRGGLDAQAVTQGTLGLFAHAAVPTHTSWALHPRHGRDLWDPLLRTGVLENQDYSRTGGAVGEIGAETESSGPKGLTRGALCQDFTVPPGETAEVTFYLTWHFPNFSELDFRGKPGAVIGVQYANRFGGAEEVARWLHAERVRLEAVAKRFHEAFFASSLPGWELDAIAAGLAVLYRSAWWDRTGRFGIWEGLGCCGLQTIDVGHYASFPILQFFPELDASQNRLSAANLEPSGKVPHLMPGQFSVNDGSGKRGRIDLPPQFVLAVWRHARWTGDLEEARRLWPVVTGNLEWLAATDTDGDGLPNNLGPDQTYDRFPLHGTSAFVGFLYLAATRAAAELAGWLGHADAAARYSEQAAHAELALDRQLWNGEYYNLSYDSAAPETNTGCMTDQLNGDWFFRQSCGRALVPDARARQALATVFRLNRRTAGPHGWLANATWPQGGGVEITRQGSDQVNCPWSGVEYATAAAMLWVGLHDEARRVVCDVFERYDDAGMRFDHAECGEFYYRALASWAVYGAEFGVAYDAREERLHLNLPHGESTFLVVVPSGWAQAHWSEVTRELRLHVLEGRLALRSVTFRGKESLFPAVVLEEDRTWSRRFA